LIFARVEYAYIDCPGEGAKALGEGGKLGLGARWFRLTLLILPENEIVLITPTPFPSQYSGWVHLFNKSFFHLMKRPDEKN